jgi:CheY-like chemotaxis protein
VARQAERYAVDLQVSVYASNGWRDAVVQDLSRTGMFLATSPLLVGTPVLVSFELAGMRVSNAARVTHALAADEARALCRTPGVGVAFHEPLAPDFAIAVDTLLRRSRAKHSQAFHVVVTDARPRMLERWSTALAAAGFSVATASTALELLGACLRQRPDVVVVDRETPMLDGFQLMEKLACDDRLAKVPVVLTTSEPSDVEPAFERGAADVIVKPFMLVEAIARVRRVAATPKHTEHVLLGGSIGDVGLASVLTMMELEKKTGRLVCSNGHAAWIDVVDGRIVDAGWSLDSSHPRVVVLALLDWQEGTFKLVAGPARPRDTQLAMSVTQLVLEQARLRDEAARAG